jgi:hypothetical protein
MKTAAYWKVPLVGLLACYGSAYGKSLLTNSVRMRAAPDWLSESRVQTVSRSIENKLEWDIRRIDVQWYASDSEFQKLIPGMSPTILAFTRTSDLSVHLGPRVKAENFDRVFGHELVHVILHQKYKGSVPAWLQEGMANFQVKFATIDYKWLAAQPRQPVESLSHPLRSSNIRYLYDASTAVVEMIASKCSLPDLLQLSVGKKLETYLKTYCNIQDLNAEFVKWLDQKSRLVSGDS